MTFVTEKEGLELDEFREGVGAQVGRDFPTWGAYIERIVGDEVIAA